MLDENIKPDEVITFGTYPHTAEGTDKIKGVKKFR